MSAERQTSSFEGVEVAAFESRHAKEISTLISRYGGVPRVAPCMQEIPLADNSPALEFADRLLAGQFDAVLFLTGVGTRTLMQTINTRYPLEQLREALGQALTVARGPKSVRALQEFKIPVNITLPDPHTSHILVSVLDGYRSGFTLEGSRIAIQEYGASNQELLQELEKRGARVFPVPVYRWALPEDLRPLQDAISAILNGEARVVLFTNAVQVDHVMQVARDMGHQEDLKRGLPNAVVCSVGPVCSEALRNNGIAIDIEPELHKMGALVYEAAKRCVSLLRMKSGNSAPGTPK
jgi:uroporphyrinogen-III synthase